MIESFSIKVEGTLFRVPRHHFIEQSEVFQDMFELPVADDAVPDGSSDEQPLKLDGVSRTDFRQLIMNGRRLLSAEIFTTHQWTSVLRLCALWQMQDLVGQVLTGLSTTSGSRDDWTALLDLAVERELPRARKLAIEKITSTFRYNGGSGIDQVVMGRNYQVKSWLQNGLENLVQQHQFFSDVEVETLGIGTVLKLCPIREDRIRQQFRYSQSIVTVESQFRDELLEMDN